MLCSQYSVISFVFLKSSNHFHIVQAFIFRRSFETSYFQPWQILVGLNIKALCFGGAELLSADLVGHHYGATILDLAPLRLKQLPQFTTPNRNMANCQDKVSS